MDDTGTVIDADVIGQQRHALNAVKDRLLVVDVVEGLSGNHVGLAIDHNRVYSQPNSSQHLGARSSSMTSARPSCSTAT